MKIYFEKDDSTKEICITTETTLKDILDRLEIVNESVILVKNGCVCLEDCKVNDSDEVKILSVVSGG